MRPRSKSARFRRDLTAWAFTCEFYSAPSFDWEGAGARDELQSALPQRSADIAAPISEPGKEVAPAQAAECSKSSLRCIRPELESLPTQIPLEERAGAHATARSSRAGSFPADDVKSRLLTFESKISTGREAREARERKPSSADGFKIALGRDSYRCPLRLSDATLDSLGSHANGSRCGGVSGSPFSSRGSAIFQGNHITMLVRAWSVVLSEAWGDWVGSMVRELPSNGFSTCHLQQSIMVEERSRCALVNLTFLDDMDVSWWLNVLSVEGATSILIPCQCC